MMQVFTFYARRLLNRPLTILISLVLPLAFTFGVVMQYQAAVANQVWLEISDPDLHSAVTHMLDSSDVEWRDVTAAQAGAETGVGMRLDGTSSTVFAARGELDAEVVSASSGVPAALLTIRLNSILTTVKYLATNSDSVDDFETALAAVATEDPPVLTQDQVVGNANSTVLVSTFNMVIFVMLLMVMTSVLTFLSDKANSTTQRVLTTARNKLAYYSQVVLVYAALGALEFALMVGVMRFGFGIDLELTALRAVLLLVAYTLLNVFAICLGLLMVSRTTKASTGRIMITAVVLPMCMLSGTLWPSSVMPGWMQKCAEVLPPDWVTTLNAQFFSGLALDDGVVVLKMCLLVGICGVLFALLSRVRSDNM